MPEIRPFRALRFDPEVVGDLSRVIAPPYDVIGPEQHRSLLARHPRNAVRLDLPEVQAGDEPDDRYRRAAKTFAQWRSDGTLHKDPHPSIYLYEQTYAVPGSDQVRTQRGFFARLKLEGLGTGVLPHERTMTAPKEDRYKLMRATGANTSPVIGLFRDEKGEATRAMDEIAATTPDIDVRDEDGIRHRIWAVSEDGPAADLVDCLVETAGAQPITIADGHHRYETALRYRDERRLTRSCETDPAYDYILMLFLESSRQRLTVLPTHRVVRGIGEAGVRALLGRAGTLFEVHEVVQRRALEVAFGSVDLAAGGEGRLGLWTRQGGAVLRARREAFEPLLPAGGPAVRRIDVTLLQVALERLCGIDPSAVAAGRLVYTKSVVEALDWVDEERDGSDAAFLLDPTPVAEIAAVAAEGDVMPQKSTYFYPKALTGLVINPHEW